MNKHEFQRSFILLALVCVLEGIVALVALITIPADPKHSLLFGYSLERWALMAGILFFQGIIILILLVGRNRHWSDGVDRWLASRWVLILLLFIFLATSGPIGFYRGTNARFLRLFPILFYAGLVSFQVMVYQLVTFHSLEQFGEAVVRWFDKKNIVMAVTLLACVPLLFASTVKQEYPLGFAGMYTLMADQIAGANFHLPLSVPYYGPGGIPFAYPPLGLYLMAIFLKLGISAWSYLRYAPPVLSWLALVPLFLLTRRISKSNLGGAVTTLSGAGSSYLFYQQTTSGGIVRGLAFGLGLLALYFFDRMVETFRWRDVVLSGVFLGLTVLTHLAYAYYYILWVGIWVITQPKRKNWIGACLVGGIGFVVAIPWIIVMLERYGISVFSNALHSHGNFSFLSLLQNPASILSVLLDNLKSVIEKPWLVVLVVIGLVILVARRKFTLPVLFLLVTLLLAEGQRFILTIAFLIAGYFIASLYSFLISKKQLTGNCRYEEEYRDVGTASPSQHPYIFRHIKAIPNEPKKRFTNLPLEKLISFVVVVGIILPVYLQSFNELSRQYPYLNLEMLEVAAFIKNNTPSKAIYLDLYTNPSDDGEEWFPYLTQREPVISRWGSEWTGSYDIQTVEDLQLRACVKMQSLICVEDWLTSIKKQPGYLIMVTGLEQLSASLRQNPEWKEVYSNTRYIIWEHR